MNIDSRWDVIIIGAGPAGALAACLLADKARVLIVEKAAFPRSKVCGSCINTTAIELLRANSLETVLTESHAIALKHLQLFENTKSARINLTGGVALSRRQLDMALVNRAIERGATFLDSTSAELSATTNGARIVEIDDKALKASVVLVADGLSGRALRRLEEFNPTISETSRFGCGTTIECNDPFFETGVIYMACSDEGYVGAVRLEDGKLDIAAAFDKNFSRTQGNSANAVATVFVQNGIPVPSGIFEVHWMGTDSLTRTRSKVAAERIFLVGDACGYAEPFTGEGIAWAMTAANAVVPHALNAIAGWNDSLIETWENEYAKNIRTKQKRSALIAKGLRSNMIRNIAVPLISAFPTVARSIVDHISTPALWRELCPQEF